MKQQSSIPHPNASIAKQRRINVRLLGETGLLFAVFALLANYIGPKAGQNGSYLIQYAVILIFQGLVLQRIYIIAHEAAHKNLDSHRLVNDVVGQIVLSSIFVPFRVYRTIHYFHHGFNRKNLTTSALDVFVSSWPITLPVQVIYFTIWYLGVFAGGFFLYSLISIVLFLFLPTRLAQKISPAFRRWDNRDRIITWIEFLSSVAIQIGYAWVFGFRVWAFTFGLPLVAFAWIYSMLVYIFHYRTTIGNEIRYNVRSVNVNRLTKWWLMNFNYHATHHMYPNIAWYELPAQTQTLPTQFAQKNRYAKSMWQAITNQFQGPIIVYQQDTDSVPELYTKRDV